MNYKYKSLKDFREDNPNLYSTLSKRNQLEKLCIDMQWELPRQQKPNGYWTKELCIEEANKYNDISDFIKNSPKAYSASKRNNWLSEIYKLKGWKGRGDRLPTNYWTKERCIEDARKYNSIIEWYKNSKSYSPARLNGWLNECTTHMIQKQKPPGYWTKERCLEIAIQYKTRTDWRKGHPASCEAARVNKQWYEECTAHMIENKKPNGYWNIKENCIEEANKYNNISDFRKKSVSAYISSCKNNWLDEIKQLMNW
jgi:hypothetical protein